MGPSIDWLALQCDLCNDWNSESSILYKIYYGKWVPENAGVHKKKSQRIQEIIVSGACDLMKYSFKIRDWILISITN